MAEPRRFTEEAKDGERIRTGAGTDEPIGTVPELEPAIPRVLSASRELRLDVEVGR
jgi:hypothetical protein